MSLVPFLKLSIRKGFTEKVRFEQRLEGSEESKSFIQASGGDMSKQRPTDAKCLWQKRAWNVLGKVGWPKNVKQNKGKGEDWEMKSKTSLGREWQSI